MHEELRKVDEVAAGLASLVDGSPELGIVLGSGLGDVVDAIDDPLTLDFADVPSMRATSVAGHPGRFVAGTLGGTRVLCMVGRVHAYEGHTVHEVVRGVRAMRRMGASTFVLTNAAGGIREDLEPGVVMAITDHLNQTGLDPGVGLADGALGPRFPNLVGTWSSPRIEALASVARERSIAFAEGVYASRIGPSYETPAEVRMLRAMGADAVGMSTVLEAIALRRMGAELVGLSCITNRAAGREGAVLDHADVQACSARMVDAVRTLVVELAKEITE